MYLQCLSAFREVAVRYLGIGAHLQGSTGSTAPAQVGDVPPFAHLGFAPIAMQEGARIAWAPPFFAGVRRRTGAERGIAVSVVDCRAALLGVPGCFHKDDFERADASLPEPILVRGVGGAVHPLNRPQTA